MREVPEVRERLLDLLLQLGHDLVGLLGVLPGQVASELQADGESDQLLLRAVVKVPLQTASFLVLGGHEPLPG